jgi:hypothetical protein
VSRSVETSTGTNAPQPRPGTAPITSFETALAAIRAAWVAPSPDARTAQAAPAKAPARPAEAEVDLTGDIDALPSVDRSQPKSEGQPGPDELRRSPKARKNAPQPPHTRTANGSPVQDEWGIFDPNQCGFSALVDKLDEVADPHDGPDRPTKVRVISVG